MYLDKYVFKLVQEDLHMVQHYKQDILVKLVISHFNLIQMWKQDV